MTTHDSHPFFDLAAVACLAAVSAGTSLVALGDPKLRFLIGAPLLAFLPGYALVSALFPARGPTGADSGLPEDTSHGLFETNRTNRGFGMAGFERIALGIGISILLTPALAAVLMFIGLFDSFVLVGALTAVTLLGVLVGAVRRYRLPEAERYDVGVGSALSSLRTLFHPNAGTNRIVTVLLIVSVFLFAGTAAYAAVAPQKGEAYTSFYVLSQNESGEYVAADYPQNLSAGESATFRLGVASHEHEETTYTLVVERQRVKRSGGNYTVAASSEVTRKQFTLAPDQTWTNEVTVEPEASSGDVRVKYYLYRGEAPNDPSDTGAYRTLRTWISLGNDRAQAETSGMQGNRDTEASSDGVERTEMETETTATTGTAQPSTATAETNTSSTDTSGDGPTGTEITTP